jgi:hypothetical protein
MFRFVLCVLFISILSCGKVPNESWTLSPSGECNEVDLSYGRAAIYHFNANDTCHYVYGMNESGFIVDKYFECDYDTYGIWRFFREENECLTF